MQKTNNGPTNTIAVAAAALAVLAVAATAIVRESITAKSHLLLSAIRVS
jgi:hypothetical protein